MKSLKAKNPEIWNYFIEGNFIVQKNDIPGVAVGCDYVGEQVNRELKDTKRNQISRNWHYLAASVLLRLREEMMNKGLVLSSSQGRHHPFITP